MSVVLLILKIIGIVLLCILGILLLAILLILFVPVRYRLEGKKEKALEGRARVTWLLHLVVAEVSYLSKLNIRIKILGIPFYDRLKKKAKEKEKEEAFEEEEEESASAEAESSGEDTASSDSVSSEEESNSPEADTTETEEAEDTVDETSDEDTEYREPEEEKEGEPKKIKKSFGQKLDEAADALEDGMEELEDMLDDVSDDLDEGIEKIRGKIESIADTISYYRRILESDGALWVFDYVVKHVKACLKNVRPRRIDADIKYSNDDPASVAGVWKIYAVAATLLGSIRGKRELNTLQDESSLEFRAVIKGRATVVVLGYHGLCLLLNRKVKKFIKLMKREDKADGGK